LAFPREPGLARYHEKTWKKFVAAQLGVKWATRPFFDHRLQTDPELQEKTDLHPDGNPVRKGLCERAKIGRWMLPGLPIVRRLYWGDWRLSWYFHA